MKDYIEKRIVEEANIIINTKTTIRDLSKLIGVSKSTIHNDMQNRLKHVNRELYNKVQTVFLEHIRTRHYLGGLSTQKKYKKVI